MYGSTYMTFRKRNDYGDRDQVGVCQGLEYGEGAGGHGWGLRRVWFQLFYILIEMEVTGLSSFVKIHTTINTVTITASDNRPAFKECFYFPW